MLMKLAFKGSVKKCGRGMDGFFDIEEISV